MKHEGPVLRPRLEALHQEARIHLMEGAGFHDIACDHGHLAAALSSSRPDLRIEASDILPGALAKAQTQHAKTPVRFFVANGFEGHRFSWDKRDGVCLAGLGGHTIIDLLEAAGGWEGPPQPPIELWLQTNQQEEILRERLYNADGVDLQEEFLLEDRGLLYLNFRVQMTLPLAIASTPLEPHFSYYGGGPRLLQGNTPLPLLERYLDEKRNFALMKAKRVSAPQERVLWYRLANKVQDHLAKLKEGKDVP